MEFHTLFPLSKKTKTADNKTMKLRGLSKTIALSTLLLAARGANPQDIAPYDKYQIENILSAVETSADPQTIIQRLNPIADSFYRDLAVTYEEPTILDPVTPFDYQKKFPWDTNTRRVFLQSALLEKQSAHLIREAPNIFHLHLELARAYTKLGDPHTAMRHYQQAFRFRSLKLTPQIWAQKERLQLLGSGQVATSANAYSEAAQNLQQGRKEYLELKTRLYLEEDQMAQSAPNTQTAQLRLQNTQTLKEKEAQLAQLRKTYDEASSAYASDEDEYNSTSAIYLVEMARIARQLAIETHEKSLAKNAPQYYNKAYTYTYTQNWDTPNNTADYTNLLAAAAHLDPQSPAISLLLGQTYESDGDPLRAIAAYEQTLDSLNRNPALLPADEIRQTQVALAGLYLNIKRYVDSAYFYETVLENDTQAGRRDRDLEFQTARLHVRHTGNYLRALQLLNSLLESAPPLDANAPPAQLAQEIRYRLTLRSYITDAHIKTLDNRQDLMANLAASRLLHLALEKLIQTQEAQLRDKKQNLVELNRQLADIYDRDAVQTLYAAQGDYEETKTLLDDLYTVRNSIDFKKIYFTMARQNEIMHQIDAAIAAYREAEALGLAPELARREMDRLSAPR